MDFEIESFVEALTSPALREAVGITVALTTVSFAAGVAIGLGVALLRGSRHLILRGLGWGYMWIFRAIPTIVQLLFVWYALPQLIPPLRGPEFAPFYAAAIALSLNEAAYAAEIIRSGLLTVDDGQRLAARALGMSPRVASRRIVAPQVIRAIVPPAANDFITLVKITSLAFVVSLPEIMSVTRTEADSTFRYAEWYGAAAVYYLVIVSVLMLSQWWFERRYIRVSQRPTRRFGVLRGFEGAR